MLAAYVPGILAAEPKTGSVVVALIDEESTLKTLVRQRGKVWLKAENPELVPHSSFFTTRCSRNWDTLLRNRNSLKTASLIS
ncbi:MAG: hypothetical protein H7Z19_19880 [Chitinophagaceae bacterium]|nr:hypothetical protein [Rubrivivax sp.]